MTSYTSNELFAQGTQAKKHTASDWAFQGNTVLEPVYDGNFDADIDAIAESVSGDSGYFSNDTDSFKAGNVDAAYNDDISSVSNVHVSTNVRPTIFYADVAASDKSNHGSTYDGTMNKSTTHAAKGNSYGNQAMRTRMSKTLYDHAPEYDNKISHKYSSVESRGPRPLEDWTKTHHRHECILYRLRSEPKPQSKKRKTGSKQ